MKANWENVVDSLYTLQRNNITRLILSLLLQRLPPQNLVTRLVGMDKKESMDCMCRGWAQGTRTSDLWGASANLSIPPRRSVKTACCVLSPHELLPHSFEPHLILG